MKMMRISEKTVRRLIKSGVIAPYKVGVRGQLRLKEGDLERYVEARRVKIEKTAVPNTESGE